jgi:hypothetical protein
MNSAFEGDMQAAMSAELWERWLWDTDPNEAVTANSLLNRMHLLGFMIARHKGRHEQVRCALAPGLGHIIHKDVVIANMTPRQLRDLVEDLQMHWERYVQEDFERVIDVVEACFIKFGAMCMRRVLKFDDIASEDPLDAGRFSVVAIRRFVCVFFCMYRQLHILDSMITCDDEARTKRIVLENESYQLHAHHVEASLEIYYQHLMHAALPPGARLVYRMEFTGFYHCISQVRVGRVLGALHVS